MGTISAELKHSKQYEKVTKKVDENKAKEILAMDSDKIKDLISQYTIATDNAKNSLKKHIDYLKAKDVIKTLNSGLRDTIAPYKACVDLCLAVLQERGDNK